MQNLHRIKGESKDGGNPMKKTIQTAAVIGGDLRQVYAANALSQRKIEVLALGFSGELPLSPSVKLCQSEEELQGADLAVFPLGITGEKDTVRTPLGMQSVSFSKCLRALEKGAFLVGGKISAQEAEQAQELHRNIRDYLKEEKMAVLNAVPTAEGALELAMHELPCTLWKSRCLVTGYGRIGRILAQRLKGLGAQVTVAARRQDALAWAQAEGYEIVPIGEMEEILAHQQVVFNTIPAMVLGREQLRCLRKDCLIIDLASKPGGVDWEGAAKLGLSAHLALALPGKAAPQTAGEIIAETVLDMISEEQ